MGYCVHIIFISPANVDNIHLQINNFTNFKNVKIWNLCDGTDDDGVVGLSIVHRLEEYKIPFVGASSDFYYNSCFKSRMKRLFKKYDVPTSPYVCFNEDEFLTLKKILNNVNDINDINDISLFVKPDDGYGSIGISDNSVCSNWKEFINQCGYLFQSGFKRLIVEEYLGGEEYSVLLTDNYIYPPVQRVYLRKGAKCMDFTSDWIDGDYKIVPVPSGTVDAHVHASHSADELKSLARKAFLSVNGNSYARVDIRAHAQTGKLYVLEVNAQPGVGESSTAWDILKLFDQNEQANHSECPKFEHSGNFGKFHFLYQIFNI